jgi:hypothetical protein
MNGAFGAGDEGPVFSWCLILVSVAILSGSKIVQTPGPEGRRLEL